MQPIQVECPKCRATSSVQNVSASAALGPSAFPQPIATLIDGISWFKATCPCGWQIVVACIDPFTLKRFGA